MTFPVSPGNGDTYLAADGKVYEYNSSEARWKILELSAARIQTKNVESPAGDGSDDGKFVMWSKPWDMFILNNPNQSAPFLGSTLMFGGLSNFTGAIDRSEAMAYTWGRNSSGQLGINNRNDQSSPVSVMGGHSFVQICAGESHFVALDVNGQAWCWGWNQRGQLGDGTLTASSTPVSVVGNYKFVSIGCGATQSFGIDESGHLWAWGHSNYGQCGTGFAPNNFSSPQSVLGNHSFIQATGGNWWSAAVRGDGVCMCWGDNRFANLGNAPGNQTDHKSSPISVSGTQGYKQVACGAYHALGLKRDGTLYAWGTNDFGELGIGNKGTSTTRPPTSVLDNHLFSQVACGEYHSFGIDTNGSAWSWGSQVNGSLGAGAVNDQSSPISVFGGHSYIAIAGRLGGGIALINDGTMYSWGSGSNGQIGNNSTSGTQNSPVLVVKTFE